MYGLRNTLIDVPAQCRLGNLGKLQQGYRRALIFFELHKRVLPHKDDIHVHITGYLLDWRALGVNTTMPLIYLAGRAVEWQ